MLHSVDLAFQFIVNAVTNESAFVVMEEFAAPTVLASVSAIAFTTFGGFIAKGAVVLSCNYFATRLVLKLFDGYTFVRTLHEMGAQVLHYFPHIHLVALSVALLIAYYCPAVSLCIVSAVAILSGLTIDAYSLSLAYLRSRVVVN